MKIINIFVLHHRESSLHGLNCFPEKWQLYRYIWYKRIHKSLFDAQNKHWFWILVYQSYTWCRLFYADFLTLHRSYEYYVYIIERGKPDRPDKPKIIAQLWKSVNVNCKLRMISHVPRGNNILTLALYIIRKVINSCIPAPERYALRASHLGPH